MKKNKIRLISLYYGSWPWYFPYFVHTFSYNKDASLLLVTDIPVNIQLPENIICLNLSLSDFSKLAERKLKFSVSVLYPYKLCDFKPAYGLIFDEYIKGYSFWGHIDIDIIFGKFSSFIDDDLLDKYDLICVRHDFVSGYFTLFRNTPILNNLFKQCSEYQRILQSDEHFCFDEVNFDWNSFAKGIHYSKIKTEIESMTHIIKKNTEMGLIRSHFDFIVIEGTPGKLEWEDGNLIFNNEYEVLLYHLVRFKTICKKKKNFKTIPKKFMITKNTIIDISR